MTGFQPQLQIWFSLGIFEKAIIIEQEAKPDQTQSPCMLLSRCFFCRLWGRDSQQVTALKLFNKPSLGHPIYRKLQQWCAWGACDVSSYSHVKLQCYYSFRSMKECHLSLFRLPLMAQQDSWVFLSCARRRN